eukprot:scaffold151172_cov19-Tisochrysis_lutea.AAC.1
MPGNKSGSDGPQTRRLREFSIPPTAPRAFLYMPVPTIEQATYPAKNRCGNYRKSEIFCRRCKKRKLRAPPKVQGGQTGAF